MEIRLRCKKCSFWSPEDNACMTDGYWCSSETTIYTNSCARETGNFGDFIKEIMMRLTTKDERNAVLQIERNRDE